MSKTAELDATVAELHICGETLIRISDELRDLFSAGTKDSTPSEPSAAPAPAVSSLTLEDVRPVLAQKSVEGHTSEVQALIRKYGAERLSQIDPVNFAVLLAEAEAL